MTKWRRSYARHPAHLCCALCCANDTQGRLTPIRSRSSRLPFLREGHGRDGPYDGANPESVVSVGTVAPALSGHSRFILD